MDATYLARIKQLAQGRDIAFAESKRGDDQLVDRLTGQFQHGRHNMPKGEAARYRQMNRFVRPWYVADRFGRVFGLAHVTKIPPDVVYDLLAIAL